MTRKKFAEALFDAIAAFRVLAEREDEKSWETCSRFKGLRAALIYGSDGEGKNEVDHYLMVELKDGSMYRIDLERVLKLEGYERLLWEDLKSAEKQVDDITDVEDDELEDDDE